MTEESLTQRQITSREAHLKALEAHRTAEHGFRAKAWDKVRAANRAVLEADREANNAVKRASMTTGGGLMALQEGVCK